MYDVMVYDPATGGDRTDLSTGSKRYAQERMDWINNSPRTQGQQMYATVEES